MNPRGGIALWTQLGGQCDELTVDGRKYCQRSSTDDGPAFRALSVHLYWAELTTRCGDRRAMAKSFQVQSSE